MGIILCRQHWWYGSYRECGPNEGTGVVGRGGGVRPAGGTPPWGGVGLPPGWAVLGAHGSGGIGLHGIGGFQPGIDFFPSVPPGVGVLAQGGRVFTEFNTTRQPHGAGVVALAGGDGQPVPPLTATGGIGVYGQGADAEEETGVTASGDPAPAGPMDPGAGVMGRGGVTSLPAGPIAAGVIGLAGQTPIPPISETGGSGVYGGGPTGVFGRGAPGVRGKSDGGAGVNGLSDADRGVFSNRSNRRRHSLSQVSSSTYPLQLRSQ
jgi:hypothetical protein